MKILTFLLLPFLAANQTYSGHKQLCSFANVIDKSIELHLKQNNEFLFTTAYINTKTQIHETAYLNGIYLAIGDTLYLTYKNCDKCCAYRSKYIISHNELISTGSCFDIVSGNIKIDKLKLVK